MSLVFDLNKTLLVLDEMNKQTDGKAQRQRDGAVQQRELRKPFKEIGLKDLRKADGKQGIHKKSFQSYSLLSVYFENAVRVAFVPSIRSRRKSGRM